MTRDTAPVFPKLSQRRQLSYTHLLLSLLSTATHTGPGQEVWGIKLLPYSLKYYRRTEIGPVKWINWPLSQILTFAGSVGQYEKALSSIMLLNYGSGLASTDWHRSRWIWKTESDGSDWCPVTDVQRSTLTLLGTLLEITRRTHLFGVDWINQMVIIWIWCSSWIFFFLRQMSDYHLRN